MSEAKITSLGIADLTEQCHCMINYLFNKMKIVGKNIF